MRLARLSALVALLAGLTLGPRVAVARPANADQLLLLLNGQPSKIGTLTSTGTGVTNATTATTFTLSAGWVLLFQCDAAAHIMAGSTIADGGTVSTTLTSASYGYKLVNAGDTFFMVLDSSTTTVSMISASGTANCAVWRMT